MTGSAIIDGALWALLLLIVVVVLVGVAVGSKTVRVNKECTAVLRCVELFYDVEQCYELHPQCREIE